jgi:hypothetical protein
MRLHAYAAQLLFKVASIAANAARRLEGRQTAKLAVPVAKGERSVTLDQTIPAITVRIAIGTELPLVAKVRGRRVDLDRPLAHDYPRGIEVRVLI